MTSRDTTSSLNDLNPAANDVPIWLNKGYMENVLKISKKDNSLKIIWIDIQPALLKGENYGGVMTRVKTKYLCKDSKTPCCANYIVKSSFENDSFAMEKMKDYDIFNREIDVYENILPKIRQKLDEINETEIIFPLAEHIDHENATIVFEDLASKSFLMADRTKGLDGKHLQIALVKLAKLHAAATALHDQNPQLFQMYDRGFFNKHTNSYAVFFENNLRMCSERVGELGPEFKNYSHKLKALVPQLMNIGKKVFEVQENKFNSFVHGDLWVNNIMYKYCENGSAPTDGVILDFQYSFWGSPVIDLHYLLSTSMQEEMRSNDEEKFVHFYYDVLVKTLKKLKFSGKVPTHHEFYIQYLEKEFYAFHSSCVIQPVMLNEEANDADFNALMGEDERSIKFRKTIYKSKRIEKNLKKLLPHFERIGVLDLQFDSHAQNSSV